MNKEKIIKAGKIAKEVVIYAKSIIKKDVPLLDIAQKIEGKIIELGGGIAFPVNLSINEVAAHFTPYYDDETLAHGLLKVDIGVHVDGFVADTAFSVDLENSDENKKLIKASKKALENSIEICKEGVSTDEIGDVIFNTIKSFGFSSIINLGGHGLGRYDFHAEPFIPNINTNKNILLENNQYAIEPFATNGNGKVHDGSPHGIYVLIDTKNVRSPIAKEILNFVIEEYGYFPFASRWLVNEFGTKALLCLRQLEQNENLHHFSQLIESSGGIVSQAEHSILIEGENVLVTTK